MQYLVILKDVVDVFDSLELWRVDAVLHGSVCLKLACLYEAKAELKPATKPVTTTITLLSLREEMEGTAPVLYDRKQLLECLEVVERALSCISSSRSTEHMDTISEVWSSTVWRTCPLLGDEVCLT